MGTTPRTFIVSSRDHWDLRRNFVHNWFETISPPSDSRSQWVSLHAMIHVIQGTVSYPKPEAIRFFARGPPDHTQSKQRTSSCVEPFRSARQRCCTHTQPRSEACTLFSVSDVTSKWVGKSRLQCSETA